MARVSAFHSASPYRLGRGVAHREKSPSHDVYYVHMHCRCVTWVVRALNSINIYYIYYIFDIVYIYVQGNLSTRASCEEVVAYNVYVDISCRVDLPVCRDIQCQIYIIYIYNIYY